MFCPNVRGLNRKKSPCQNYKNPAGLIQCEVSANNLNVAVLKYGNFHYVLSPSGIVRNIPIRNKCSVGAEKVAVDFMRIYCYNYIRMEVQKNKSIGFVL